MQSAKSGKLECTGRHVVAGDAEPQQTNMQAWKLMHLDSTAFCSNLHCILTPLLSAGRIIPIPICSDNYQTVVDSITVTTIAAANTRDQDDRRTRSVAPSRLECSTVYCYCDHQLALLSSSGRHEVSMPHSARHTPQGEAPSVTSFGQIIEYIESMPVHSQGDHSAWSLASEFYC